MVHFKIHIILLLFLFFYTGNGFAEAWNERSNDFVKVFFHTGDGENVSGLQAAFKNVRPDLEEKLGVTLPYIPRIYIVSSQTEFDRATQGALPSWSQGVSFSRGGQIILKSPAFSKNISAFNQTAVHELVHLMVGQKSENNVPRWFNEGLAQLLSGEAQGKPLMPLSQALWAKSLIPLTAIEQVDRLDQSDAELAYLESFHATEFLINQYGWNTVRELLTLLGEGLSWENALFRTLEIDHAGFEAEWINSLEKSHRWLILMDTPIYLLTGATLLVLIAVVMVYWRRRQIYKRWESEEDSYAGTI